MIAGAVLQAVAGGLFECAGCPGGEVEAVVVGGLLAEVQLPRGECHPDRDLPPRGLAGGRAGGRADRFQGRRALPAFGEAGPHLAAQPPDWPAELLGLAQPEVLLWAGQRGHLRVMPEAEAVPSAG